MGKAVQAEVRINAMLAWASKSEELFADPSEFDCSLYTINTQSGPASLIGGEVEPSSPAKGCNSKTHLHLFTKVTEAAVGQSEGFPQFETFMSDIFGHDSEKLIDWVQRAIGYSQLSRSYSWLTEQEQMASRRFSSCCRNSWVTIAKWPTSRLLLQERNLMSELWRLSESSRVFD